MTKHELGANDIFADLSEEAIKFFCNLCEIKVYTEETVDMATGGILLTGSGFVPEDEEGAE